MTKRKEIVSLAVQKIMEKIKGKQKTTWKIAWPSQIIKKTIEHEGDKVTNHNQMRWNNSGKETGRVGNPQKSWGSPEKSIIKTCKNSEKWGDLLSLNTSYHHSIVIAWKLAKGKIIRRALEKMCLQFISTESKTETWSKVKRLNKTSFPLLSIIFSHSEEILARQWLCILASDKYDYARYTCKKNMHLRRQSPFL